MIKESSSGAFLNAIDAVRQRIVGIEKSGSHKNYKYVTAKDMISTVRKEMIKAGLVLIPRGERFILAEVVGKMRYVTIEMAFELRLLDEPDIKHAMVVIGDAADVGDKAIWKAKTGAMKYLFAQLFQIPFGVDPESDSSVDAAASATTAEEWMPRVVKALTSDPWECLRRSMDSYGSKAVHDALTVSGWDIDGDKWPTARQRAILADRLSRLAAG